MYIICFLSCLIALILLIWLKSDALINWGELFKLSKFLHVDDFRIERVKQIEGGHFSFSYPHFLNTKYNNFITRLLVCPLCLSVWLSSFFCLIFSVIGTSFIFMTLIPMVCVLSLILYGGIVELLSI